MGLVRGDLTVLVLSNDYGKPQPAVVLQSDSFQEGLSFVVVRLTSDLRETSELVRIRVQPSIVVPAKRLAGWKQTLWISLRPL